MIQDMLHDEAFGRTAPEYQATPLQRIASLAIQEAMDPECEPDARRQAREWIALNGYGLRIDLVNDVKMNADGKRQDSTS